MVGYKYTKEQVDSVVETLNNYHGLPVKNGLSKFSIDSFIEFEGYYCIEFNEWTNILGEPQDINI